MRIALTRDVSPAMDRCELSHLARSPIDQARAVAQHAAYEQCLMELGCRVHRVPSDASMPDAVFIEDTAVVVDELAVAPAQGGVAAGRNGGVAALAPMPGARRGPGTLDGGDVLRIGRTVYVGDSAEAPRQHRPPGSCWPHGTTA
jgi:dimethylargininase